MAYISTFAAKTNLGVYTVDFPRTCVEVKLT
jgi:hypothetical protein